MKALLGAVFALAVASACTGAVSRLDGEGTPDANDPPGADASTPLDAGDHPDDAGAGGTDGGVLPEDGGQMAPDAGEDAGIDAGQPGRPFVYVGSGAGRIYLYSVDEDAGTLTPQGAQDAGANPSFLAFHPTRDFLYAVNERTPGTAAAFRLDPTTGQLTFLNTASSGGNGPTHIAVDRSGRVVMTANYTAGTAAVLPITPNGGIAAPSDTEAPGARAHQILTDLTNRWAFVPCLGDDLVAQFELNPDAGTLTPNAVPILALPQGAGPRHMDFHPTNQFAYIINELDSTMTACSFDAATGRLAVTQTLSTLPANFGGQNTTAEVFVHPNGRFVFGSNRGHNSIVTFAVNAADGRLTLVGHTPTGGNTPRSFALNAEGTLLIVANQNSGTLTGFRVDPNTGALTPLGQLATPPSPAYVGFRVLPPN